MELFLDSADVSVINKYSRIGLINGITTNPLILAEQVHDFEAILNALCDSVKGPVNIEVTAQTSKLIVKEAIILSKIRENIVVKIPANFEGFQSMQTLSKKGVKMNITLVYTANQALIAAKLGASYVSPFVGRLDSTSTGGTKLIKEISKIYSNYNFKTKIIAASMRNDIYVKRAALAGAHIATVPPSVLENMMYSELTESTLKDFLKNWDNTNKNIEYHNFITKQKGL